jgi:hypothetical protein
MSRSTKALYAFLLAPIRALCPAHPVLPVLFIQIIFNKELRSGRNEKKMVYGKSVRNSRAIQYTSVCGYQTSEYYQMRLR